MPFSKGLLKNPICHESSGARSGAMVSLHSHTLYSRESLGFVHRYAKDCAPLRHALDRGAKRYRALHGSNLDMDRAWWTPPLAPRDAWALESRHIGERFGARPMVSLTDHDDIEAPVTLRILEECRQTPISLEWTVPYQGTFFHFGVHNLPPSTARDRLAALRSYTAAPNPHDLGNLLEDLSRDRRILTVFNHPCWDEKGLGKERHMQSACNLMAQFGAFVHACEFNGLRPLSENEEAIAFSRLWRKPVISGGDRHALEPNTVLNMTGADTFQDFVGEIRDGYSRVLITAAYSEPFALRILHNLAQVLAENASHGFGWRTWNERVFYLCDDGIIRSVAELWGKRQPAAVTIFIGGVRLLHQPSVKTAFTRLFKRPASSPSGTLEQAPPPSL